MSAMKPRNYVAAAFNGTVDERGENFEGRIVGLEGGASVFLSRAAPTLPLPSVCARGLPWGRCYQRFDGSEPV